MDFIYLDFNFITTSKAIIIIIIVSFIIIIIIIIKVSIISVVGYY
jgi:hypothetical protein